MSRNPILIEVTSNGQRIGVITPEQFRKFMNVPACRPEFLTDQLAEFNAQKEQAGEPERVSTILAT